MKHGQIGDNMKEHVSRHHALLEVDDSVLIIIDVQQSFLDKLPKEDSKLLVNRISWLTGVAVTLNIPLVVTAEDIPDCGQTVDQISQKFPPGTKEHNKMSFGLAADSEILSAVNQTGRKTAVLVGLETDVCVMQSAIGLLENGYRVAVVADATGSPGTGHGFGIERMRSAGVLVTSTKSAFYEWIRTVNRAVELDEKHSKELSVPDGVYL